MRDREPNSQHLTGVVAVEQHRSPHAAIGSTAVMHPPPDGDNLRGVDPEHAESIRASVSDRTRIAQAAEVVHALADPTRLTIAATLLHGQRLCVGDVAWIVGKRQNLVSHHLRLLRNAGLVTSRRDGRLQIFELSGRGRLLVVTALALPTPRRRPSR